MCQGLHSRLDHIDGGCIHTQPTVQLWGQGGAEGGAGHVCIGDELVGSRVCCDVSAHPLALALLRLDA